MLINLQLNLNVGPEDEDVDQKEWTTSSHFILIRSLVCWQDDSPLGLCAIWS